MVTKKEPTIKKPRAPKAAAKPAAEKKPRVPRKKVEDSAPETIVAEATVVETAPILSEKPKIAGGKYVFATGRRKTAIANVRMFSGSGKHIINKKPFDQYFSHSILRDEVLQPLEVTGLGSDFHITAHVSGGGIRAQAQAVRHGLAQALATLNQDVRKILKSNTYLTRDDRKKERKKPGLRGARRAPQWAKR
jgi:small subunit ribosomal protein S9